MHRFGRLLSIALTLVFAFGLTVQAAQVHAMAMGMTAASSMDGASSDGCPGCDDMGKSAMAASGCQSAACTNAMPMVLAAAPTILPMPVASFTVWKSEFIAGLSAPPDPRPPRPVLFA